MRLGAFAEHLNQGCGTGFWQRRDAEAFAHGQTARDGQPRTVTAVPTAHHTHSVYFVQIDRKEAA